MAKHLISRRAGVSRLVSWIPLLISVSSCVVIPLQHLSISHHINLTKRPYDHAFTFHQKCECGVDHDPTERQYIASSISHKSRCLRLAAERPATLATRSRLRCTTSHQTRVWRKHQRHAARDDAGSRLVRGLLLCVEEIDACEAQVIGWCGGKGDVAVCELLVSKSVLRFHMRSHFEYHRCVIDFRRFLL